MHRIGGVNFNNILRATFALEILNTFRQQSRATTGTILQLLQPKLCTQMLFKQNGIYFWLCAKWLCFYAFRYSLGEIYPRISSNLISTNGLNEQRTLYNNNINYLYQLFVQQSKCNSKFKERKREGKRGKELSNFLVQLDRPLHLHRMLDQASQLELLLQLGLAPLVQTVIAISFVIQKEKKINQPTYWHDVYAPLYLTWARW